MKPTLNYPVDKQIIGIAAESVAKAGEHVLVESMGLFTCDQGQDFYRRLDNLSQYPEKADLLPSRLGVMACVFHLKETKVYIDNFEVVAKVRVRNSNRKINAGDPLYKRDIVGVESAELRGVDLPVDAGIAIILSLGWRKGLFFDYRPCCPPEHRRNRDDYDLSTLLGQMLSHLAFTEHFILTQAEWEKVIHAGWFPFIYLAGGRWSFIFDAILRNRPLGDYEQTIHEDLLADITTVRSLVLKFSASPLESCR